MNKKIFLILSLSITFLRAPVALDRLEFIPVDPVVCNLTKEQEVFVNAFYQEGTKRSKSFWEDDFVIALSEKEKIFCISIQYLQEDLKKRVIGVIIGRFIGQNNDTVFIDYLVIDPKFQKMGIGKKSLEYVFKQFKCKKIKVYSSPTARSFYLKMNFRLSEDDGCYVLNQ